MCLVGLLLSVHVLNTSQTAPQTPPETSQNCPKAFAKPAAKRPRIILDVFPKPLSNLQRIQVFVSEF